MSYIITAEIFLNEGDEAKINKVLLEPRIRLLHRDLPSESVTLDMRSDFDTNAADTKWFCERLVDNGILSFDIRHSY